MKNLIKTSITVLIGIGLVVLVGCAIRWLSYNQQAYRDGYKDGYDYIKTVRQLQRQLVDRGHPIKVDGKMCKGWNDPNHSETLQAWYKEMGNQYGIYYCEKAGM